MLALTRTEVHAFGGFNVQELLLVLILGGRLRLSPVRHVRFFSEKKINETLSGFDKMTKKVTKSKEWHYFWFSSELIWLPFNTALKTKRLIIINEFMSKSDQNKL